MSPPAPLLAALAYHRRGWQPLPVPAGTKKANRPGWPQFRTADEEAVRRAFPRPDMNVGVLLGEPSSGLVDFDLDCDEALGIAGPLLPETGAVFGRSARRGSHLLYVSPEMGTKKFVAPDGDVLMEIRATGQTLFPPSTHSGDRVAWEREGDPASVPAKDLEQAAGRLAAACLLARAWPAKGSRNEAALALAGALLRSRFSPDEARLFIRAVCTAAGDEEVESRCGVVGATLRKLEAGEEATGLPRLEKLVGSAAIALLLKWLALDRSTGTSGGDDRRREIRLHAGELPTAVNEAELALLQHGDRIYQRETMLVRVLRTKRAGEKQGTKRPAGSLIIRAVETPYLVELFTTVARFLRLDKRSNQWVPTDCPEKVAKTYLARAGEWQVAVLSGVVEAPTLRADGSILCVEGYDEETGLVFDAGGTVFPDIPLEPSLDDARKALGELKRVFETFPFVKACDSSVLLAAILTALLRRLFRAAPLFAIRAPKMATGKSLLADAIALIATGRNAPVMSQGPSEEEDSKRILSVLIEGDPVACIDNIDRPLAGAALCSVLTQDTYKGRLLGKSQMVEVPTRTTWLATGNNLCFAGDLSSRVLPCDLDAGCENPEARHFDVDVRKHILDHRGELVRAGLTIARAHLVAGRPDQGLSTYGRFEEWSEWIRSPLVWLGEADPCEGRARIEQVDPIRELVREVLREWHGQFQSKPVRAAQVIEAAGRDHRRELWQALSEAASGRDGRPSARALGKWLASYQGRVEGGLRVVRCGDRQGTALWRVESVEGVGFVGIVGTSSSYAENCQEEGSDIHIEGEPEPHETHQTHGSADSAEHGWEAQGA